MESKPRMVPMARGPELDHFLKHQDDLGIPHPIRSNGNIVLVDADELKAWRASQHTSGVPHGS